MSIPKKVVKRIQDMLKQYQSVLELQRSRDVSEADTVTVVKDILSDVFGYDKYADLTGEHAIRGTYCDLAVQFNNKLHLLIEVKAIGMALIERHVKQAIDYAANQGVEWVVLTNGTEWILYHVLFKKPIDKEEVVRFDLLQMNARQEDHVERLFLISKEGVSKSVLTEFRDRKDATNRFMVAAILLNSESVISAIRREVRRVSEIMVDADTITRVLREQVIKRDALEGDSAADASRRYSRKGEKSRRKRASGATDAADAQTTKHQLVSGSESNLDK